MFKHKMNQKKAQVTTFVIIGIVLLFIIAIAIYTFNQQTLSETNLFDVTEDRNPQLLEVRGTIEFCLEELTKQALQRVGRNAGHVEPPTNLRATNEIPYANNALNFFGNTIPYMYYLNNNPRCTNCNFNINLPSLNTGTNSIKAQVERYIEQNIELCANLQQFEETIRIESQSPSVQVNFDDLDTKTRMIWPLTFYVYQSDATLTESVYDSTLDLRFKNMYETVQEILFSTLIGRQTLERWTLEVLQYLSLAEEIPPTIPETRFSSTPIIYNLIEVEQLIKQELSDNTNLIQTYGTRGYSRTFGQIAPTELLYEKFNVFLDQDPEYLRNLKIDYHFFQTWPFYLNVNPSFGTVAMPRNNPLKVGPVATVNRMEYEFFYDLAFPVLIEIEDASSFGGLEPFSFRFPYEVNIRNTNTFQTDFEPQSQLATSLQDPSLATQELIVHTINGYTGQAMSDVSLSFECVDESLAIGVTQMNGLEASLQTTVPSCLGAIIQVIDEELISDRVLVEENPVVVRVYEKRPVTVTLEKKMLDTHTITRSNEMTEHFWTYNQRQEQLQRGETAQIFMNLLIDGEPSLIFETANITRENPTTTFNLVPGEYQITVISSLVFEEYFENGQDFFETQPEILRIKESGVLFGLVGGVDERIPINSSIFFDEMLIGIHNNENNLFTITPTNLANQATLTIPYFSYDIEDITYTRHLNVFGSLIELYEEDPSRLRPRFS